MFARPPCNPRVRPRAWLDSPVAPRAAFYLNSTHRQPRAKVILTKTCRKLPAPCRTRLSRRDCTERGPFGQGKLCGRVVEEGETRRGGEGEMSEWRMTNDEW